MGEDQLRERIIARRGTIMMRPASSGRKRPRSGAGPSRLRGTRAIEPS